MLMTLFPLNMADLCSLSTENRGDLMCFAGQDFEASEVEAPSVLELSHHMFTKRVGVI